MFQDSDDVNDWMHYQPKDGSEPLQLVFADNVYSRNAIVTAHGIANPVWLTVQDSPFEWEYGVLYMKGEPVTAAALEALEAAGIYNFSVRLTHVIHGAI